MLIRRGISWSCPARSLRPCLHLFSPLPHTSCLLGSCVNDKHQRLHSSPRTYLPRSFSRNFAGNIAGDLPVIFSGNFGGSVSGKVSGNSARDFSTSTPSRVPSGPGSHRSSAGMDVHLLVYDLSGGLARSMSMGLLGFQLDAVYHTSIELGGVEYVYDGGIHTIRPGSSHLGRPLERHLLGRTDMPVDVIAEYVESLREVFTAQAYDLFRHNCNNFSNDFATFLVGKGIPDHISNMPQAVLDSPFGKMILPQLTQMVEARKAQQGGLLGIQKDALGSTSAERAQVAQVEERRSSVLKLATSVDELKSHLDQASTSCAVVFFTSAHCGPCKVLYPVYDQLAEELGSKATLIKVDVSQVHEASQQYQIRGTPTLVTFLHGREQERVVGADAARLRSIVELLVEMAFPAHPHQALYLRHISMPHPKPVLYSKVPPLDKLLSKLGDAADKDVVKGMKHFIETRAHDGAAQSTLPHLPAFSDFLQSATRELPLGLMFAAVDLFRCGLADARLSGYYAEETGHKTVKTILEYVNGLAECPYALRLVTLHMACNLWSSPLYPDQILRDAQLREPLVRLVSTSLLDDGHSSVRVAASSLLFNIASSNSVKRTGSSEDVLPEADQVELAAALLEAISQESSSEEALKGMLLALGHLVYRVSMEGELVELLRAMDAQDTVLSKRKQYPQEDLIAEVGEELLGKGLRRK